MKPKQSFCCMGVANRVNGNEEGTDAFFNSSLPYFQHAGDFPDSKSAQAIKDKDDLQFFR